MFQRSSYFIVAAIVSVQWEDGGLWTHGVIVKPNNDYHRVCPYTIQVMKTGRLIMWNSKHICSTSITADEYLPTRTNQESIRGLGGHFHMGHIHVNTSTSQAALSEHYRETMGQSMHTQMQRGES